MVSITLIILILYLTIMFLVAWWFSRKESLSAYFLNSKKTSLWMLTFSNVATLIGAGATVAIVAEVYNSGISYGLVLPVGFIIGAILLAIFSGKIREFGEKEGIYTLADFFKKRFDAKNNMLVGILQIFLLFVWVAIQAVAFASLASVLVGFDYNIALILVSLVTIIYTAIGGLKIDIISDFIQFWIIFIMFAIVAVLGIAEIGGIGNLFAQVPQGHLNPFAFGGASWFIGGIILSGFLFVAGTHHWQRILSARSEKIAKKSFYYSIPFLFLISIFALIMGLVASIILIDINKNTAIFALMEELLPPIAFGIALAAILAVIMSSIDSLLIGGSTIVYRGLFRKNEFVSKKELFFARTITVLFGFISFFIAFMVPNIITLSLFQSYFALIFIPPIIAGLYSKKTSSNASFWSLIIPFVFLIVFFSIIGKNIFLITTPMGILIIVFYDKIFKKKKGF